MNLDFVRAFQALLQDLHAIYYRCGAEVERVDKYGRLRAYWPKRYRQHLKMAERIGIDEVVAYVKRTVTRPKPTRGFGELLIAQRPGLTVEASVVDATKPYHFLFDATTIAISRRRLGR